MDDIQEWVAERDGKLIRWFAEGRRDEEVLLLSAEHGHDLSPEGIIEKRSTLRKQVIALQASEGLRLLEYLPLVNPAARIGALSRLFERIEASIDWCETNDKYSHVARLSDTGTRVLRDLKEEMESLQVTDVTGRSQFDMAELSPQKRRKLLEYSRGWQEIYDAPDQPELAEGITAVTDVTD